MEKMKMHSMDIINDNVNKIAQLFPECITEVINNDNKIEKVVDFDKLKSLFSSSVVEGKKERYQFTWPDKSKAMALVNQPINATLRPCREESVNFDTTENLYIEGDNLDVLKLLRETYYGKIKMIYIDPPYNTGNDFVYEDDFSQDAESYKSNSGQYDDQGNRLQKNQESNGRFHTDWLNMIYPRLKIARDLLSEDGVIFISIDDNEIDNLIKICNEIFGENNHLGTLIVNSTPNARDYGHIGKMHEFCILYGKNSIFTSTKMLPEQDKSFKYQDSDGGFNIHPLYNSNEAFTRTNRPNLYYPFYLYPNEKIGKDFYKIGFENKEGSIEIFPPKSVKNHVQFVWRWGRDKAQTYMNKEIIGYKTEENEYRIVQKMRHSEKLIRSLLTDTKYSSRRGTAEVENLLKGKYFSFPKPVSLLYDFLYVGTNINDIILDFFSGSSTTAHAVMELNKEDGGHRKFIMVQIPEECDKKSEAYKAGYKNICEIGKERIRKAGKKILEEKNANSDDLFADNSNTLDVGFRVLKLDSSNMTDVYYKPDELDQEDLTNLISNIKEGRTSEDLLFQVMLDLGVLLSSNIETMEINGKTVFNVNEGYLMACFDEKVDEETVIEIAKKKPQFFVIRDLSMSSDSMMVNFDQIFDRFSPETTRKVL